MGRTGYTSGRSALNKILYNCCRTLVDPQHRRNSDLVRVKRAAICKEVTAKTRGEGAATPHYEVLTIEELNRAIEYAREQSPERDEAPPTERALAYLRRTAMIVGLRYMDFSKVVVEWEEKEYTGEAARALFESLWHVGKLPKPWYARVRREYVNPRWNTLLFAGGFRGKARYPATMYDNDLTAQEVQYLTKNIKQVEQYSQPVPLAVSAN